MNSITLQNQAVFYPLPVYWCYIGMTLECLSDVVDTIFYDSISDCFVMWHGLEYLDTSLAKVLPEEMNLGSSRGIVLRVFCSLRRCWLLRISDRMTQRAYQTV
jgi:hypothetical protein